MKEQQQQQQHDAPAPEASPAQAQASPAGRSREEETAPTTGGTIQDDLRRAMRGWGADWRAIVARVERATPEEKAAVLGDSALMQKLEKELKRRFPQVQALLLSNSGEQTGGEQAGGEQAGGRERADAVSGEQAAEAARGAVVNAARVQLDQTIKTSDDLAQVQAAFAQYWNITLGDETTTAGYSVNLLRRVHEALKGIPEQDVRAGAWKQLILIDGGGGSWSAHTGGLRLGAGAAAGGQARYGDHNVDWLSAVVRHEIGHAVDTALGGVRGFKRDVGGWWGGGTAGDINAWANKMGNGWAGTGGSPTTSEQQQISERIWAAMQTVYGSFNTPPPLTDGVAAEHPIRKYIDAGVPVIEVAKGCLKHGGHFYSHSDSIKEINGLCFSVNTYYNRFQVCKPEVRDNILRDYQLFSEDEFFAEAYTVFYEGFTPESTEAPGKHLKVAAWRNWMLQNVHNRGGSPAQAAENGTTSPTIGTHAGKHSDD